MGNFGEFPPKAEDGDRGSEGGLLRRGRRPTVAREHVRGPDVISTATVKGAREGARVEIMSVGCPQTAGRASRSGQVPDYPSRNIPAAGALPV